MADLKESVKRGALIVGVFGVIGMGMGLTAHFPIAYLNEQFSGGFVGPLLSGLLAFQSLLIVVFVAPVVAGVAGLANGAADPNPWSAVASSAGGAFLGFYFMVLFAGLLVIGGFGGGPVAQDTPTPTVGENEFTVPPDYETETPGGIQVQIETPTPADPASTVRSGVRSIALGGIPAALVGGISAGLGYWLRE